MNVKLPRLLSGVLALSTATTLLHANPSPVAFDWFEISGKNANESKISAGEYRNPIFTGFYPDPSICRVGDDFYLINSTFAYFPGIPIFHSKDLVNWRQIGHVIDRPEQLRYDGLGVSEAIFAPAITHCNGTFYVICTMIGSNGNFLVTAKNPAGPWSDPVKLEFGGIDPSLFIDDDGRGWVVNNDDPDGTPLYDGHRAIRIQEYDVKEKKMIGSRKVLVNGGVDISTKPIWIEGPHLFKRDGWYYLCAAEGGTGPGHSQVVLRSRTVEGPYSPWEKNPILTQRDLDDNAPGAVTCTGHADLVEGPGNQWWAVFLGVRPYERGFSPMGRETFLLPVKWTDDGWPTILPAGERVPLTGKSPGGASVKPSATAPLNGSFTWRDDFNEKALSPLWIMLRTPKETWWKFDKTPGQLNLTPQAELLSGTGNPSYLARRVQHSDFNATTVLEVPKEEGVSAGLAVFQNEKHHYFLAVHREEKESFVYLEQVNGGVKKVVATASLPIASKVALRVKANGSKCSFEYSLKPEAWQVLTADSDAKLLTSAVAGGFVGATAGPHVRVDK